MEALLIKLEQAQEDILAGRYDAALAAHEEFHALESPDPALPFIRRFALKDWAQLARVHAPARLALQKIREREAALLRQGDVYTALRTPDGGQAERFHDIVAIDDALGQQEATYSLFRQLDEARPELAQRYFTHAFESVLAAQDYALAGRFVSDPLVRLREHGARVNELWTQYWPAPSARMEARLMAEVAGYAGAASRLLRLMRGLGQAADDALALEPFASADARQWVEQELATPGAIAAAMAEKQKDGDQPAADTQ